MDPRVKKLSGLLVNYSCDIQPGEKVLIDYEGECTKPLIKQLIKDVYAAEGKPYVTARDGELIREIMLGCDEEQIEFLNETMLHQMKGMDAYIAVRAGLNVSELSDVPSEKLNLYYKLTSPTLDYRVNKTKWVVLRYPGPSMAQLAGTSQEAFEDFYFDVCTLDYERMSKAMDPLVELMNKTDKVRLVAPGTDLTFSIKGVGAVKCDGLRNIPDGEVYTAPVRESVNGVISYNTVSEEQGFTYENIRFEIENGKIVNATANNNEKINALLDTDEGARYFGEFAIGVNPYVLHPMKDTLFDEKICGSFHLTPGRCYEDAPNGNESAVHWDLVLIQRPEYGGGEIYFDDVLIRKDGLFVIPELEGLNPDKLK
ncbi:MAG: aminopeptidase [Anaerovoracaceae bacterium]|nr:aminopeptidase [Anaerovoracaceae bacterium]